jgi:hypothetical protein
MCRFGKLLGKFFPFQTIVLPNAFSDVPPINTLFKKQKQKTLFKKQNTTFLKKLPPFI